MTSIRADKRLGQHFLRDESVIHRLLAAIHPQPGEALLEIGPGLGALTLPPALSLRLPPALHRWASYT